MKKEISQRKDIELLVNTFYQKVQKDELIGYVFNEVMQVNWETHLPKMYNFWESVLFGAGTYRGNPLITHLQVNKQETLNKTHFERWTQLWHQTLDELFTGPIAHEAKTRAETMRALMLLKINEQNENENFIQ